MSQEETKPNPVVAFFRGLFKLVYGYLAVVGLLVTISMVSVMFILASGGGEVGAAKVKLPDEVNLSMQLSGQIAQSEPDEFEAILMRVFGQKPGLYLPQLRAVLRRAGIDSRVKSLDIEIGSLSASLAEYEELRRILSDFKATGKQVQVVLNEPTDWHYYVSTVANRIVVNPAASVELFGPSFHLIYFGEGLRKLGVDIEVIRYGKYKSAFEPFIQNKPSEPTLEQYNAMEQSIRSVLTTRIGEGRGKDPAEVEKWLKQSIFTVDEAVQLGIIDGTGYFSGPAPDQEDGKGPIAVADYGDATAGDENPLAADDKVSGIALITAIGEIHMNEEGSGDEVIAPERMREEIRWAKDNKDAKAVVMRVSSPGGSAIASDMIWRELADLAAVKPLVVSMGAVAASGGYYISAPASKILAEPTTITGSIGVIGMLPNFSPFEEKYGVSFHVISNSDRKNVIDMGTKSTGHDKDLIQSSIDQVYKVFISKVAQGRKLEVEAVDAMGQGRVYTGAQALELKLVDQLGGLQDAFREAKILGGLDPEKLYAVHTYDGGKFDLRRCLSSSREIMRCLQGISLRMPSGHDMSDMLTGGVQAAPAVAGRVRNWVKVAESERALALWPDYVSVVR
jgi:protease-4